MIKRLGSDNLTTALTGLAELVKQIGTWHDTVSICAEWLESWPPNACAEPRGCEKHAIVWHGRFVWDAE